MALRFDITKLDDPRRDHNGYLNAKSHVTRTGVFVYNHPDGTTTRELRHPDEVFSKDSIASLKNRPITDGHPADGKLNSENTRRLAVGMSIDEPTKNDIYLDTNIQITDENVISRVLDDENPLREMSCGYESEVVKGDGTYQGEKYDHIQTKIKYNHIALVQRGRAGPQVRLQLDSVDAIEEGLHFDMDHGEHMKNKNKDESGFGKHLAMLRDKKGINNADLAKAAGIDEDTLKGIISGDIKRPPDKRIEGFAKILGVSTESLMKKLPAKTEKGDSDMIKIKRDAVTIDKYKMDSFEVVVDDDVDKSEKAVILVMDRLDSAHAHILVLKADKENMQGRIDALKDEGKVTLATLNEQVKERTDAVTVANYLGLRDFQDVETEDLKKLVVAKAYPQVKIDELSKDHIEGRYDTVIEGMKLDGENLQKTLSLKTMQSNGGERFKSHHDDISPRDKFLTDTENMYMSEQDKKLQA